MSTELAAPPSGYFSIPRALKDALKLYKRNLIKFSLIAVVLQSLTLVASAFEHSEAPYLIGAEIDWLGLALAVLVNLIANTLIDAALVVCALQALRGQDRVLGELYRSVRVAAPILAINVIVFIPFAVYSGLEALNDYAAIALARLVLALGGMMLLVRWFLAPPAMVGEGLGFRAALRRSVVLTKDDRWGLFGAIILALLAFKVLDGVIAGIGGTGFPRTVHMLPLPISFATEYVVPAISRAFLAVLAVVSYHTLRLAKEGDSTQVIARVFD
jgi:hypothetical protein